MTDRAQFEAMLEALINEDQDAAKEIFHNIVVGKSREIYEELLAEDFSPEEANRAAGSHQSESMEEEGADEDMEEDMEEEGDDDSEENPFGGEDDEEEPEDDGEDDAEDEFGGEDDAEGGDMEDRVMDLEDALEDLKAEFEQLLSQEGEEGGHDMDAIHDAGAMGGDDDMEMGMGDEAEGMPMMEYYKKVSVSHGDNGTNTKSLIDNMKNDMGGSNKNIAQNFSTTTGGTTGGLAKNTPGDLTKGMNVHNRVQSNAGKTAFKKTEPGHGAEKKGKGETNVDKKSLIGGKIR